MQVELNVRLQVYIGSGCHGSQAVAPQRPDQSPHVRAAQELSGTHKVLPEQPGKAQADSAQSKPV